MAHFPGESHFYLQSKPSELGAHSSCNRSVSQERISPCRLGGLYFQVTDMPREGWQKLDQHYNCLWESRKILPPSRQLRQVALIWHTNSSIQISLTMWSKLRKDCEGGRWYHSQKTWWPLHTCPFLLPRSSPFNTPFPGHRMFGHGKERVSEGRLIQIMNDLAESCVFVRRDNGNNETFDWIPYKWLQWKKEDTRSQGDPLVSRWWYQA